MTIRTSALSREAGRLIRLSLIALVCSLALVGGTAQAEPTVGRLTAFEPVVYLHVASPVIRVGETGKVMIRVRNIRDMTGFQVKVLYDPAVLQVVDSDLGLDGIQIERGTVFGPNPGKAGNSADNVAGFVEYGLHTVGGEPVTTGFDLLGTITFQAISSANSDVSFDEGASGLADPMALPIQAEWRSARVLGDAANIFVPLALNSHD